MRRTQVYTNTLAVFMVILWSVNASDPYTTCVDSCQPRLDTYDEQSGIIGPPGFPGQKGDRGDDTEVRKRYTKESWKRCQPLTINLPRRSQITDYVRWVAPMNDASSLTICAGVHFDEVGDIRGTLASYSTREHVNALLILRRTVSFMNKKFKLPPYLGRPNAHHHLCISIQSLPTTRNLWVYINGRERFRQTLEHNADEVLPGGGYFLIGQDQDSLLGGFETRQSYFGTIDNFRVFYTWFSSGNAQETYRKFCKCKNYDNRPNDENVELFGAASFTKTSCINSFQSYP